MIDLRDVNNLFIKKIIAWLFGKSSSEGVGWGVSPPVIWGVSLGTCFGSQKKIEKPNFQAQVVQKVYNAIHRINHYPVDSTIGFPNTYPLDSDLSGG